MRPAGDRIEQMVRGGCYRSRWLRDLCLSQEVVAHLEGIWGIPIAPHPMGLQLGHLNYEPVGVGTAVDKWHHDTLPLDCVVAATIRGGRFEYFLGTKREAAALADAGRTPPAHRLVAPDVPGAGWAVALHGDMVVHRVTPLEELRERISMLNGYVAIDTRRADQSRSSDLIDVDDPEVLWTEWAKYAAWRSRGRLDTLVEELTWTGDRDEIIARLSVAVEDVQQTIADMQLGARGTHHYGG